MPDSQIPDPATFVDKFTKQANEWREWRKAWEIHAREEGSAVPGQPFRIYDEWTGKVLSDFDELLKTQSQVNTMILAAIDDLRKRATDT